MDPNDEDYHRQIDDLNDSVEGLKEMVAELRQQNKTREQQFHRALEARAAKVREEEEKNYEYILYGLIISLAVELILLMIIIVSYWK